MPDRARLHPLAREFGAVADEYERGRPGYAPAAIGALAAELGLGPGDRVLDLAAGTGKLTRALVNFGFDVTAVEPLAPLRARLASALPADRVLDGVAESIPLPARSVAVVTVANAFHWFDHPRALAEIRRVLAISPPGALAVLRTSPDWTGASWADELGRIVVRHRPAHPNLDGRPWDEHVSAAGGFAAPWHVRVTSFAAADLEGVIAHMATVSWIAGLEPAERAARLAEMRAVIEAGTTPDRLGVHVDIGLARLSAP